MNSLVFTEFPKEDFNISLPLCSNKCGHVIRRVSSFKPLNTYLEVPIGEYSFRILSKVKIISAFSWLYYIGTYGYCTKVKAVFTHNCITNVWGGALTVSSIK